MVNNTFFITENLVNTYIDLLLIFNCQVDQGVSREVTLLNLLEITC